MARKTEKKNGLSFEDALKELEAIVDRLEKQDVALESALKDYEKGISLYRFCLEKLNAIQKKIEVINKQAEGAGGLEPFSALLDDEETDA